MSSKIYLYQRIGNPEWATCDQSRFVELSSHRLFATKICYEEPPELAELQATIVQLKADYRELSTENDRLLDVACTAEAEIERLKGGQGEPVGFRYRTTNGPWEWMGESPYADGRIKHCDSSERLEPLYASQTAPVSVVLPERFDESQYRGTSLLAVRRWNACIDKVKELNQ